MAKFILTKQVLDNKEEKDVCINLDYVMFAKPYTLDAIELTFSNGKTMIVKNTIKDLI